MSSIFLISSHVIFSERHIVWKIFANKNVCFTPNQFNSGIDLVIENFAKLSSFCCVFTITLICKAKKLATLLLFCAVCSSGTVTKRRQKNLLSNFIFDVSLGQERQASSEITVTWEGNQPRSRTVKRGSTNLTELIKKLRSVNWINPMNYCVTKR